MEFDYSHLSPEHAKTLRHLKKHGSLPAKPCGSDEKYFYFRDPFGSLTVVRKNN